MSPAPGALVVLEGADGSGTTTQAERLAEGLRALGLRVYVTREPTSGLVGSLLRRVLTRELDVEGPRRDDILALLFAADRLDHLRCEVDPRLAEGCVVVSDRYDLSSLIYQSVLGAASPERLDWLRALNRLARRPELTLVLDVPLEVAAARRAGRGGPAELFDADSVQARLLQAYRAPSRFVPGDRVVVVDGARPVEEVTERLLREVVPVVAPRAEGGGPEPAPAE